MEENQGGVTKEELSLLLSNSSAEPQMNHSNTSPSNKSDGFLPRATRKRKKAPLLTRLFQ